MSLCRDRRHFVFVLFYSPRSFSSVRNVWYGDEKKENEIKENCTRMICRFSWRHRLVCSYWKLVISHVMNAFKSDSILRVCSGNSTSSGLLEILVRPLWLSFVVDVVGLPQRVILPSLWRGRQRWGFWLTSSGFLLTTSTSRWWFPGLQLDQGNRPRPSKWTRFSFSTNCHRPP